MDSVLDELVKNSASCIEKMEKKEEWKRMKEELKEMAMKSDDEGVKKLRLIFIDSFEVMKEEMKRNEEEWNEMDMNGVMDDVKRVSEKVNMNDSKVYVFSNGQKKVISNELVKKYPESLLNVNMIDIDSRNNDNEIEIDFQFKYLNEIVSYMANKCDINELNGIEFEEFCVELIEMNIPFRSDIMNRLYNGFNEYGIGWKNRCLMVNGNKYKMMFDCVKLRLNDFQYNVETDRTEIIKNVDEEISPLPYDNDCSSDDDSYDSNDKELSFKTIDLMNDFENYLKKPSQYIKNESINFRAINKLFELMSIDIKHSIANSYVLHYTSSLCFGSQIIDNTEYDEYIKEWCGSYKWKLLYRASEHRYTAESFHDYCDDKGPTLIVIKSSEGWIFGGYTTNSWDNIDECGIFLNII